MEGLSILCLTPNKWEKAQPIMMLFWDIAPNQEEIVKFLNNAYNILFSAVINNSLFGQVIGYILER
jgi:hypothetical protein